MSASSDDNENLTEEDGLVENRDISSPILLNDPRKEPVAKFLGMCYICCFVLALTPCIVALLFAYEYVNNESSVICQQPINNNKYIIPLDIWLYTAAILTIIISLIYIFINGYQTFAASLIIYTKISEFLLSPLHALFQFLITSFHTVWGIIGIYIYCNQMTSECQSTDIATMILIFSILELINTCCVSCCVCCMIANRDRFNSTLSSTITTHKV